MARKLTPLLFYWIVWGLLFVFWGFRVTPGTTIFLDQTASTILKLFRMITPSIALIFVLLPFRFTWIKEKRIMRLVPFMLLFIWALEVANQIKPFSPTGSPVTWGIMGLVVITVAHYNQKAGYFKGLMLGIICGFAAMYLWEALYQFIVYAKGHFEIKETNTFFICMIASWPLFCLPLLTRISIGWKFAGILFAITLVAWGLTGWWTYRVYNGGWGVGEWNYGFYIIQRLNKLAFSLFFARLVFNKYELRNSQSIQYVQHGRSDAVGSVTQRPD